MNYDFDTPIDRRGTSSVKWDNLDKSFGVDDILPMWVADMDFSCPKAIMDSIERRNSHGVFGYTTRPESLHESVVNWMKTRHEWDIKKEWLLYSPGVVTSLNLATMFFTEPGDSIIIQSPVYPPFYAAVENHDRIVASNSLVEKDGSYSIDFEDLEKKMADGCKTMILCSPHNPVGRVWTRDELERIGALCEKYGVLLVSDEIHSDLIYPEYRHISIATISKYVEQNSITCIAPSKTFNIPGLSLSAVIIPNPELRARFQRAIDSVGISMSNVFGITAMEAAYTHGEEWLDSLIPYLKGNLIYLLEFFDRYIPEIKVVRPQGTYLVWLDCRGLNMDGETLHRFIAQEAGVGLVKGVDFGSEGEGFMRMNIACPRPTLEEGLERIHKAVKKWRVANQRYPRDKYGEAGR